MGITVKRPTTDDGKDGIEYGGNGESHHFDGYYGSHYLCLISKIRRAGQIMHTSPWPILLLLDLNVFNDVFF